MIREQAVHLQDAMYSLFEEEREKERKKDGVLVLVILVMQDKVKYIM